MTEQLNSARNMHALLIGIDRYLPNELPEGLFYRDLAACVRDIDEVEIFLREDMGLTGQQITKLTASVDQTGGGRERAETAPTYENIVKEFKNLIAVANCGDQVYIHYSGHGGRAPTMFEELKGKDGLDEVLVPCDIGETQGRYFRDIEFARLIHEMLNKDLIVTVVLDSCHSGSGVRGPVKYAGPRGIGVPDKTARPKDSLVALDKELIESWLTLAKEKRRDFSLSSHWMINPKGYVLLAACKANEFAYELAVDGNPPRGALTYFWLQALRQLGAGATYKMAYDWLLANVREHLEEQTPQLEGEGNRVIFDSRQIQPYYAVNVLKVDEPASRVLLRAGTAQGLRKGARFNVYPWGTGDVKERANRQALVQISELGATDSWADIIERFKDSQITQGAQAVLLDQGDLKLYGKVCLLANPHLPADVGQRAALDAVESAIKQEASGFIELVGDDVSPDFYVSLNEHSQYEISDIAKSPKQLRPSLEANDPQSATRVAQRLVHLTKYRNVRSLDNYDHLSKLAGKVRVELAGYMPDYDPDDKPKPLPLDTPEVVDGEWIFLRVKNDYSSTLNLAVLDLQPDYGISQVYPESPALYESIEPGREELLPLRASLPEGYETGEDTIKAFLTIGATDFLWLQLPALDEPLPTRSHNRSTSDPLQAVINSLIPPELRARHVRVPSSNKQWCTKQVIVKVVPAGSRK